jgi:FAD/FMN-containing dehydrogenase
MELSGWGRHPVVASCVYRAEKISDLTGMVTPQRRRTLLARGAGRSYGDASLNGDGDTVLTTRLNRMLSFDATTGVLRCEAGVQISEILDVFVPRGWFPPVTPGTKFVTVGGAIACDVHGKNHHRDGSFGRFVKEISLLLASGAIIRCSAHSHQDVFRATLGGMGLTGIILEATIALQRVETPIIKLRKLKARNLAETFALFDEHEPGYQYSVAWVDCLATGRHLGRSVLMFGNHASKVDVADHRVHAGLLSKDWLRVPVDAPASLLNPLTMRAFNRLYYGLTPTQTDSLEHYDPYFYPLDSIRDWNRLYGKRGFVQYQCVVPQQESDALAELLTLSSERGRGSFLAILKRFGPQTGWLSFPMPGYTLTLDLPVTAGLEAFLDELDRVVVRHGGRVYLAKDAHMSAAAFVDMYPQWQRWAEVKARIDPRGLFSSDLSRRLRMTQ